MTRAPGLILKSEGPVPLPDLMDRLAKLDPARASYVAPWSLARTFHHLTQGVEFSLTGYPKMKPGLFRATLGRAAFHVFHAKGAMRHATDAPIPGEEVKDGDPAHARDQLVQALTRFQASDALHPHFAYGRLTKAQYAVAHAMHVADHLEDCRV